MSAALGGQAEETGRPVRDGALRIVLWFLKILWRERPWAVLASILLMVVQGLVPAARAVAMERLLGAVRALEQAGGETRAVAVWVGVFCGIQLTAMALRAGRSISRAYLRENASWRLQQLIVSRAGEVPLEEFEHPAFHDRLRRARVAATWRSIMIFENTLSLAETAVSLASFLILLLRAHVALPVVLVLGATPNLISQMRRGQERYRLRREQTPEERRAEYLVELLTDRDAAKELRLYRLGRHLIDEWHTTASTLRDQRLQLVRKQQVRLGVARLGLIAGSTTAILLLLDRAVDGALDIETFTALMYVANQFQGMLGQAMRQMSSVYEETLYLSDLREFVEMEPKERGSVALPEGRPMRIEFENVSFAYPDGPEVLHDLSFVIEPGEKVALVGPNGSGKTTLIKLLLGLYRPTRGRILVDGVDMRELDPETVRRQAAAVFQDYLRYQLTARDNVGFGRAERLDDTPAIERATQAAGADEVVASLRSGFDTWLGRTFEGGQDLSGGQWQKLAIARAYFREAQLLVLDEPTAALDARAEMEIFQQFRALAGDRTAIFVSHRMASARIADRVLVLEDGRLMEYGRHDELIRRGGLYASMFEAQAQWYRGRGVAEG